MRQLNKILFVLYFLVLFFYGLLIKFLYGTFLFSYLKFVPEIIVVLFLITCFFISKERRGYQLIDVAMLVVVLTSCAISIFNNSTFSSVAVFIRDFLIPILCLILLKSLRLDRRLIRFYYKALAYISIIFLLSSLYFGYMQWSSSYEYTSNWYLNKVVYGYDGESPIKISTAQGIVRALGLVGNSAKYGFYSVFSFAFITLYFKRFHHFFFSFIFALANIWFSTNKTAIVSIFVVALAELILFYYKGKHRLMIFVFSFVSIGIIAFAYMALHMEKFSSIQDRFDLWGSYDYIGFRNAIIGTDIFSYFGLENGWMSVIDNTVLFGFSSFGVVAFTFFIVYILKYSTRTKYLIVLSILFILFGLTTNIFSGRCFFSIYCLLAGIETSKFSFIHKQEYKYELFPSSIRYCKKDGYRNSINQLNT